MKNNCCCFCLRVDSAALYCHAVVVLNYYHLLNSAVIKKKNVEVGEMLTYDVLSKELKNNK